MKNFFQQLWAKYNFIIIVIGLLAIFFGVIGLNNVFSAVHNFTGKDNPIVTAIVLICFFGGLGGVAYWRYKAGKK